MTAKRAATFYRVSTKGQLDENEILLQRRACQAYITRAGWTLVKEYTERGVSGYKVPTERRDAGNGPVSELLELKCYWK